MVPERKQELKNWLGWSGACVFLAHPNIDIKINQVFAYLCHNANNIQSNRIQFTAPNLHSWKWIGVQRGQQALWAIPDWICPRYVVVCSLGFFKASSTIPTTPTVEPETQNGSSPMPSRAWCGNRPQSQGQGESLCTVQWAGKKQSDNGLDLQ